MRDCQSRREGLLMHNKMLFVRSQKSQKSPQPIAWAYVGSANLSESAWQVFRFHIILFLFIAVCAARAEK